MVLMSVRGVLLWYQSVFRGVTAQTCSGDLEAGMEWKPAPDWLLLGCFFPYSTFICDIGSLQVQWRQMMRRGLDLWRSGSCFGTGVDRSVLKMGLEMSCVLIVKLLDVSKQHSISLALSR
jgi:hypothetical protein